MIKLKIEYNINNSNENIVQEYGSESISDLVAGEQITADASTPYFGVIGQYGSVKVKDKNKLISKYYENGLLENNATIELYYNNNLIRKYESENITYEEKNHIFNFTFKESQLQTFENIKVYKILYDSNKSAMYLFEKLFSYTGFSNYNMSDELETKLNNINIKNYHFKGGSLLEAFNMFCNLTMTCITIKKGMLEVVDYV